ncbi:telomerase reverse transcriptase-like [Glandiceps talaboti]
MVVIKSMFYVTESGVYRNHIFFYRKIIWNKCRSLGVNEYLNKGMLKKVPFQEAKKTLQVLGKSHCNLRFVPKMASLRPITTMTGSSNMQVKAKEVSLYGLLQILTYIKDKLDHWIGFEICQYAKFKDGKNIFGAQQEPAKRLYFLKLDVQNCFDTIKQDKLLEIMEGVLSKMNQGMYTLRHYAINGVHQGQVYKHHKWNVSPLTEFLPDITKFVSRERKRNSSLSKKVIVELNTNFVEKNEALLQKLRKHICGNMVKIGGNFYSQICGIPQGSVLSTLLCSYYYGNMEQKYLKGVDKDGGLINDTCEQLTADR